MAMNQEPAKRCCRTCRYWTMKRTPWYYTLGECTVIQSYLGLGAVPEDVAQQLHAYSTRPQATATSVDAGWMFDDDACVQGYEPRTS